MHHQRSSYALKLLKMGAVHFMLNLLLGCAALSTIGYYFYQNDQTGVYMGLGMIVVWLLSMLAFAIRGAALKCSLCMSPIWSGRKCQKHSKVKPALGVSYRLGVAMGVLFKGSYRCPYCGEPFSARKARGRERRAR